MSENQTVLTNDMKFLIKELYEQVFGITDALSVPSKATPTVATVNNPYKGLKQVTIDFLDALRKEFRGGEILLSDETFQKLRYEHRLSSVSYTIDTLVERGLAEVTDNCNEGKSRRIVSFHLKP